MLTSEEQQEIAKVIKKHGAGFACYDEDGVLKGYVAQLETSTEFTPFIMRSYPVRPSLMVGMTTELRKLYQHGIIEHGQATCFSPVFVRPKPDSDKVRLILDFRTLNKGLTTTHFPLLTRPELHTKLARLKDVKYLTAIDISQAFLLWVAPRV